MRRRGFALVEWLVVICIIAGFTSILMPSRAEAREAAVLIQCGANLRSVGQGLVMYEQANRKLPYAEVGAGATTPVSNQRKWVHEVSCILGTDTGDPSVE